jgi:hypothetical protein
LNNPSDEFKDLVRDRGICPNIPVFGEPALQDIRIGILFGQNPNRYFAGVFVIWSVERDGGDRIALKATPAFFFSGESERRLNLIKTSSVLGGLTAGMLIRGRSMLSSCRPCRALGMVDSTTLNKWQQQHPRALGWGRARTEAAKPRRNGQRGLSLRALPKERITEVWRQTLEKLRAQFDVP